MGSFSKLRKDPLLECLSELHRWQPPGNFKGALCVALQRIIPASHVSYSIIDTVRWTTRAAGTTLTKPRQQFQRYEAQLNEYVTRHPCVNHWLAHPEENLTSISDVAPTREYRRTGLYNEVYRPQGVEDQLALNLSAGTPGQWHVIATSRHRRGFGAVDRERLAILRPHLIEAVGRARSLARLHASESRALAQLDLLAPAAITLAPGGAGKGLFFNPRAQEILATWFEFKPLQTGDALPEALTRWLCEQRRPSSGDALRTPRLPFVRHSGDGRRLVVNFLEGMDRRDDMLVLEEQGGEPNAAATLRAALGLSERQAEVLRWIAQGKSNADIGEILGISLPTVKMHVTRLFETLGCETRTAAACIALEATGRTKPGR